MNFILITN